MAELTTLKKPGMAGLRLVGILCTHATAWVDSVVRPVLGPLLFSFGLLRGRDDSSCGDCCFSLFGRDDTMEKSSFEVSW